ncbi:MAG: hemerythrin domain-containing protein [Chloroflexi bacterium]|nr:hemerythrin domain-containing protein [Chloroflexota bacterium]
MSLDPIQHLLDEHKAIMAQVADLRKAVRDLEARGDAALPDSLPVLRRFGQLMETQLARHAKKEDEALFPALEALFGAEGTPTAVMRVEHAEIHRRGELFRRTLSELQTVEHPALEAKGEALRSLTGVKGGGADALRATATEIIELIEWHFGKEEQILFPMAEQMLDPETLAQVGSRMEALA